MGFGANKTPVEVIREGAFEGTHFRDIYSGVTGKWYKNHEKNFISWKIIQIVMMSVSINMVLNAKDRYDFGKIKVGLIK